MTKINIKYSTNINLKPMRKIITYFAVFLLLFSTLKAQNITPQLKLPEEVKITESHACLDNSGVYHLTTDLNGNFRFYYSQITGKEGISAALPVDSLNKLIPEGTTIKGFCLSADGNQIFFSANLTGGLGGFDIFSSSKIKNSWTMPENLGSPINSTDDEYEPSISSDKNLLFFTRPVKEENDFTDDFECKKIFVAEKNIEGKWETPYELTKPLNLYCECRPVIASDNKTLYYSSVREDNKKGFDIMYTKMIAKKIWKTPVIIDTLSTEDNDYTLSFPVTNNFFIFNSIPQKIKKNSEFKLTKTVVPLGFLPEKAIIFTGRVYDLYTNKPLKATIEISHPETKRKIAGYSTRPEDGFFYIILPKGQKYDVSVFKENYSYRFTQIDAREIKKTTIKKKDFMLYKSVSLFLNVFDAEDFSPLEANIIVKDADKATDVKSRITQDRKGRYILGLNIGKNYYIRVEANNHVAFEMPFSLNEIVQFNNFEKDVELAPTYEDIEFDIADMETSELIDSVDIVITDEETGKEITVKTKKTSDGKYILKFKKGKKYKIKVKAPKGYAFYNTSLDMTKEAPQKMDVKLEPLKAETKLTFNNIQFETNSADIDINSFSELDELVELMKDNPNMKVEISAHTDDVGSETYNLRLSEKRANSVVNYLIENGVKTNQLIAKGYGESKPIVPNDSDENRAKNRRVELRILDINLDNSGTE